MCTLYILCCGNYVALKFVEVHFSRQSIYWWINLIFSSRLVLSLVRTGLEYSLLKGWTSSTPKMWLFWGLNWTAPLFNHSDWLELLCLPVLWDRWNLCAAPNFSIAVLCQALQTLISLCSAEYSVNHLRGPPMQISESPSLTALSFSVRCLTNFSCFNSPKI